MEKIVGTQEVAELLGVSRQRVHQLAKDPLFPVPLARLKQGSVWKTNQIKKWRRTHRPQTDVPAGTVTLPPRDPERPQDDPWDADAVRYLLKKSRGAGGWRRGELLECLREQPNRVTRQPERVAEAAQLATAFGVERRREPGGTTIHFFRTDKKAPSPYPSSAAERRAWRAAVR